MLWAGGSAPGGQVIGETDAHGAYPKSEPIPPRDIAYTLLSWLGIDPHQLWIPPDGRKVIPTGKLINELAG